MNLLEINNLTVCFYKDFIFLKAVDNVSFSIAKGEIHALIGESGSGKTITALSILGLIDSPPGIVGGHIHFDGSDILRGLDTNCKVTEDKGTIVSVEHSHKWHQAHQERLKKIRGNRIAMIFQEPLSSLDPFYTVGEQLSEVLLHWNLCSSQTEARELGIEWLRKVAIKYPDRIFDYYPYQLSGGMSQRVMIAIALCSKPDLLIADEPTTALDVTIQQEIVFLIKELRETLNLTILFITHDMTLVKSIADNVTVLYKGRVLEKGTMGELVKKSNGFIHPFTECLLQPVTRWREWQGEALIATKSPLTPEGCVYFQGCSKRLAKCERQSPPASNLSITHQTYCWLCEASSK